MNQPIVAALFILSSVAAQSCGSSGPAGHVPAQLVGSWYAGSGGTTAPYDPATGHWGMPSGKGLVYVLNADASYTKAFQSYNSASGCTNGFTAFESGSANAESATLSLTPKSGHLKVSDTCAPSLDSDDPLKELTPEVFTWELNGDELTLTAPNGAWSTFRRL